MKIKVLIGAIVIVGLAGIFLAMSDDKATYEESLPASLVGEVMPAPEAADVEVIPEGSAKAVAAKDVKVGDTFGGFTVTSIEKSPTRSEIDIIRFSGEATVSGRTFYANGDFFPYNCFEVAATSAMEIPRLKDASKDPFFCFSNAGVIGNEDKRWEGEQITIVIKDYILDLRGIETTDKTTLVRFVE